VRAVQTNIVNKTIQKAKNGKYSVDENNPFFEECKTKVDMKWSGEKSRGVIYSIAVTTHGGAEQLTEAVRKGEVTVVEDNGVQFYSWRELETGKRTQIDSAKTIARKNNIDLDQFNKIGDVLDSIGWDFAVTPAVLAKAIYIYTPYVYLTL
jgi:hypothetical protein